MSTEDRRGGGEGEGLPGTKGSRRSESGGEFGGRGRRRISRGREDGGRLGGWRKSKTAGGTVFVEGRGAKESSHLAIGHFDGLSC